MKVEKGEGEAKKGLNKLKGGVEWGRSGYKICTKKGIRKSREKMFIFVDTDGQDSSLLSTFQFLMQSPKYVYKCISQSCMKTTWCYIILTVLNPSA